MKEYEVNITQARMRFADVVNRAAYEGSRVLVCRRDHIVCAVVSVKELIRLRALPPEADPYAEAERAWQEGKRALEERLVREQAERTAKLAQTQRGGGTEAEETEVWAGNGGEPEDAGEQESAGEEEDAGEEGHLAAESDVEGD